MAWFDVLPDEIHLKIFSYLSVRDISLSVRNVCTRWRTLSEDKEIWIDRCYSPYTITPEEEIVCMLKNMPALRKFKYGGTCNVIETLSQYCRRVSVLKIPHITLNATLFKLTMERLTELSNLEINITPTIEGAEITRIIGQSETLVNLHSCSYGADTIQKGFLKPIADGCPNLNTLKCYHSFFPNSEICYLMERKKHQLVQYRHSGLLSADLINAINECTNLKKLTFICPVTPLHEIPPVTQLQKLTEPRVISTDAQNITLTLFIYTLPNLSSLCIHNTYGHIDEPLNEIILKCPLLTHLSLSGNDELHSRGLRNISSCKLLKYLKVSYCKQLDVTALKYVADGCPQLQYLNVSFIPITDGMFRQILRCRNLKTLIMWGCDLAGIDLNLISTNISGLTYLH
jgi:hypothetical protein